MFQARPNLPLIPKVGDPIRAEFLASLVGIAGYFEGKPIDPFTLGEGIFVGRPTLLRVASLTFPGATTTPAWEGGNGIVYGMTNSAVLDATSGGIYAAIEYDTDQYPGISLAEVNGGTFSAVGDFVWAMPVQTPSGMIFVFQPASGATSNTLYRPTDSTAIIADRRWVYQLTPLRVQADGITWEDDPEGTVIENCYNENEIFNTSGATLQGNDADLSLPPFGTGAGTIDLILQPIKENHPVTITRRTSSSGSGSGSGSGVITWFNAPNTIQEPCNE